MYRSSKLGYIKNIEEKTSKNISKKIFSNICKVRYFELETKKAHSLKKTTPLVYLSLGQESVSAAVSIEMMGSYVLAQHRGHGPYLSFNGDPKKLRDELLGLKSGCCKGKGGSPMIHDMKKKIIGHCGLIGDHVPVAVGVALNSKKKVTCFFGDGAAEEDYVLAALGEAVSKKLKILFICDDNDLSVLTPIKDRRSWSIVNVAKGFGMPAVDISDNPWVINHWCNKFKSKLPALINIKTCRDIWHVGSGRDDSLEWDRFEITKNKMKNIIGKETSKIENHFINWAKKLWKN